jgi:hypothetical protein
MFHLPNSALQNVLLQKSTLIMVQQHGLLLVQTRVGLMLLVFFPLQRAEVTSLGNGNKKAWHKSVESSGG